jgi:tetratricopeptide (TPR) repeat protein
MKPRSKSFDPKYPAQYQDGPGNLPTAYGKNSRPGCSLAVLALLIFLAFVAAAGAGFWFMVAQPELAAAGQAGRDFIGLLQAGKFDLAYQVTTPRFQNEQPAEKFRTNMEELEVADSTMSSWVLDRFDIIEPHGTAYFTTKSSAEIYIFLELKKAGAAWKIDSLGYSRPSTPPVSPDPDGAGASGEGGAATGASASDLIDRGNEAFNRQDYGEAIKLYSGAIELEPGNAAALYNRANTYYAQNDYDKALADYDRAIKSSPDQAVYFNNRGNTHLALNRTEAAIADYDRAVALDPKDALAYYNRGNARRKLDDDDGAQADFNAALAADPNYDSAYYARGNLAYDRGEFEKAVADFTRAINLQPEPDYYNNRGNALYSQKKYERALADYTRVVELTPADSDGFFNRANTYVKLGDLAKAGADYEQALALNPEADDVMARYARVLATTNNAKFRNPARALDLATLANKSTDGEKSSYLDTLAAACAAAGKFDDAVKYQDQALGKLAPDTEASARAAYQARLELYRQQKPFVEDLRGK